MIDIADKESAIKKACQAEAILLLMDGCKDSFQREVLTELADNLIGSVTCWLMSSEAAE
ncbi:hypothetical protein [Hafnia paralvei]|uniref:hypothetical protein n=1 Tax=Hafnia paralvei TaxID=546367 RepID=UPI00187D5E23|nr:hypothetical protein [Hafnia paralvei]